MILNSNCKSYPNAIFVYSFCSPKLWLLHTCIICFFLLYFSYRLFVKLFFVMGVLWVFEVITYSPVFSKSWVLSYELKYLLIWNSYYEFSLKVISWAVSGFGVRWYWIAFDLFNILRAVAIFIIFVCKPDIIFALEQNYPKLKRNYLFLTTYNYFLSESSGP